MTDDKKVGFKTKMLEALFKILFSSSDHFLGMGTREWIVKTSEHEFW